MGEKETAAEESQLVKPKTKSNQSNDRMDQGDAGADGGDEEGRKAGSTREADQGFRTALVDADGPNPIGDLDGDGPSEAAINNSHSNIKNLREAGGGGGVEAAINNTKSNIKNQMSGPENDHGDAAGIAIGEPGSSTAGQSQPKSS